MRTVIWDLDGTLADTEALHFEAWAATMRHYDVVYSYDAFKAGFGRSNRAILSELLGVSPDAPEIDDVSQHKESTFRQMLPGANVQLLPGAAAWLDEFARAGVNQVLASSGPMANIVAIMTHLAVGDYFRAILTGSPLPQGKPHPAIFRHAAAAVSVPPQECTVIEDSSHGVAAARRAGMRCIVVGPLAGSPELATLLAKTPGPQTCARRRLVDLTWADWAALWGEAHVPT